MTRNGGVCQKYSGNWRSAGAKAPRRRSDPRLKYGVQFNDNGTAALVGDVKPADIGFASPETAGRESTSYWGVLWNEFLGTFMYSFTARLFVAVFGGTTAAATIPTLYGAAFANAFAYFGAMATFGGISGGHFNPAITLTVMLVEFYARFHWFGKFNWGNREEERGKSPWRSWIGLVPYIVVQLIAFLFSALLIWGLLRGSPRSAPIALGIPFVTNNSSDGQTFGAELLGSFMFLVGYLLLLKMFGSDRSWMANAIRSLAFGFWYFALFMTFAFFAGAVWNPGLWLAYAFISGRYEDWWILFVPALVAAIAASVFCLIHWWIGNRRGLTRIIQRRRL